MKRLRRVGGCIGFVSRQPAQCKCIFCRGWLTAGECRLTREEQAELAAYADANGPRWRSRLQEEWLSGDTLRRVRNTIGPRGIRDIKTADLLAVHEVNER